MGIIGGSLKGLCRGYIDKYPYVAVGHCAEGKVTIGFFKSDSSTVRITLNAKPYTLKLYP